MAEHEQSNEHMAAWAMQELSRSDITFSERVEARKVIGEIVEKADAYRGAVEALLVATTTVEDWEARHKVKHPDPEGFRRAAIEQGKAALSSLGGQ